MIKTKNNRNIVLRYVLLFLAIWISIWILRHPKQKIIHTRDFQAIKTSGIIHVATEYNKISYYVDGDSISGFNYELIRAFASEMGLKADIHPVMSEYERIKGLHDGTYDLVAYNLQTTSELKDSILLTIPIILTRQVLIQRKKGMTKAPYIKSQLDLGHKTLNVPKDSPCIMRIRNLSNEIGDTIFIKEISKYSSEQLMYMVAHGNIDYAVCDENIARAYITHLPNIDMHTAISFTQFYSWGVSKRSPVLCNKLNTWLQKYKMSKQFKRMYQKFINKNTDYIK